MPKVRARRRWFAAWRRAPRRPQDDPADWGTAFGLELSLQPADDPAAARLSPPRKGWIARLKRRGSRAA